MVNVGSFFCHIDRWLDDVPMFSPSYRSYVLHSADIYFQTVSTAPRGTAATDTMETLDYDPELAAASVPPAVAISIEDNVVQKNVASSWRQLDLIFTLPDQSIIGIFGTWTGHRMCS